MNKKSLTVADSFSYLSTASLKICNHKDTLWFTFWRKTKTGAVKMATSPINLSKPCDVKQLWKWSLADHFGAFQRPLCWLDKSVFGLPFGLWGNLRGLKRRLQTFQHKNIWVKFNLLPCASGGTCGLNALLVKIASFEHSSSHSKTSWTIW